MFKAMTGDMLGTADNTTPIKRDKFGDTAACGDSLSFLLHTEKPLIFLKSKIKEFIFTDVALIFIERDNAAGIKRFIRRFEWQTNAISVHSIKFTTPGAGMTDYACDIEFILGSELIAIDIVKEEIEYAKKVYRSIVEIARLQQQNSILNGIAGKALSATFSTSGDLGPIIVSATKLIAEQFVPVGFGEVIERNMMM